MSSEQKFTIAYWRENIMADVDGFVGWFEDQQRRYPLEFPQTLSMFELDNQFICWLGSQAGKASQENVDESSHDNG